MRLLKIGYAWIQFTSIHSHIPLLHPSKLLNSKQWVLHDQTILTICKHFIKNVWIWNKNYCHECLTFDIINSPLCAGKINTWNKCSLKHVINQKQVTAANFNFSTLGQRSWNVTNKLLEHKQISTQSKIKAIENIAYDHLQLIQKIWYNSCFRHNMSFEKSC